MSHTNPFANSEIVNEYRWLNNYAVLYQNKQVDEEYFLDANNLRCALTLFRSLPEFPAKLYTDGIFEEYTKMFCQNNRQKNAHRGIIDSKKHPVIPEYKELEKSHTGFVIEGERLIKRAIDDKLMLKNIIYSNKSMLEKDGYIKKAHCACYLSNEGIMSAVSSSKPVPSEIAACIMTQYSLESVLYGEYTSLLITDNVSNPDNLGLVIRTADACGADAVIVTGTGAAPYHKNCVRASRGAIGRLPVLHYPDGKSIVAELKSIGITVIGTSAHAESLIGHADVPKKFAAVIGSESFGISPEIAELCDIMIKIDMARGQSSFNVAVAAGIILNRLMIR
ncbi:MAG: RNA methyltransferase [Oscillospiraceae bacterium]|nr:RNA methyltransferase [Oscillospiraceae bacterium]